LVVTDTSPTGYAQWVTTLTTEKPLRPNTVNFYWRDNGVLKHAIDDGVGGFTGTGITPASCSVVYATGVITIRTDADTVAAEDEAWLDFRWFNEDSDAAQVRLTWISRLITAYPRRIRSIQDMDDVKMVKEALDGFDIDKVMQTALGGYINKEISGSILNNILAEATGGVTWDSAVPTGSEWAFHRLSLLQPLREARNSIRQNISRGGGNVIIAGNDLMNLIEDFGESLWKPISQKSEPIGPYTAGTLAGTYKVIKNQDYPDDKVAMVYKGSDMEASYGVGVHIGLYATDLYQLDDFKERQGMATRIGETMMFDNSVTEMTITYTP
jgi:Major capsid protein Gp23